MAVPDSVWEFSDNFDWSPAAVFEYFEAQWPTAHNDEKCTLFDLARALYWVCVDWHSGMGSELYRIQCQLDYHPGACECSPEGSTEDEDEAPAYAYGMIERALQIQEGRV